MRLFSGLVLATSLLLIPASRADAQVAINFGSPFYGYYGSAYGGYGGFGPFVGTPWGMNSYSSAYSVYTAPGTAYFNSGYYAPGLVGSVYGYPGLGYGGYGYGYGYGIPGYGYGFGSAPYFGGRRRSGYVSTGLFMGLPRPFAGLVRVPR
jgi:hypothetical protein